MKKLFALIFLCFLFQYIHAQKTLIRHEAADLGGEIHPATITDIFGADVKSVEKKWSSYLKKQDGKLKEEDDELFLDNAIISAISPDTLDIYSTVKSSGTVVVIAMAVNRNGEFVNNSNGNYPAIDKLLYDFVIEVRKEMAEDEIKSAEKILKTHEKEFDNLIKENKKMEGDIKEMREKISENERKIKQNDEEIEKKKRDVSQQGAAVKELENKLKEIE